MTFTREDRDNLFNAVESLKKYRRADLADERGKNLLETLYTDLLPNDHILKKSMKDNTTFLIGRKGTGKSTIFLRIEQELRKREYYLPCYIDVKTVYESSQTQFINLDYLDEYLSKNTLQKYLIERTFIQSVLTQIREEIKKRYDTVFNKIIKLIGEPKSELVKQNLTNLKQRIEDNELIKEIEIPVIKTITVKEKKAREKTNEEDEIIGVGEINVGVSKVGLTGGYKSGNSFGEKTTQKNSNEIENNFSNIFLQVFQIKDIITEIKEILNILDIKHIVILLDDFSEIDDNAIKTFVDVILAPLNNWSEEFIKFKIAAYPSRIHFGKIDPGKIDTINLDFYSLYSEFERDKMEEHAIDFTKRLLEKRIHHFANKKADYYFDTSKATLEEYYELLFQTSMNVPRIIGYILSYCYQSKIIYDKQITKSDIELAAQKYYEDKIEPFFYTTTYSLLSIDEKITTLQLKELLNKFVEKLSDIKKKITTGDYKGEAYIQTSPYASHFYFNPKLDEFLKTLELNYFISKYNDMSDKDGNLSSIYCINYGLAQKHNLYWGKPKGSKHRKYFIERPFNFNGLIKDFLSTSKQIHCTNPSCNQNFTVDQLQFLEFTKFKCNNCGNPVIVESISENIKNEIENIQEEKLLPKHDLEIILELVKSNEPMFAREIAEELDISSYVIAKRGKILDEKKGLIERQKESNLYTYKLTNTARNLYE